VTIIQERSTEGPRRRTQRPTYSARLKSTFLPSRMPSMDIETILRSHEGKTIEFKRDLSATDGIVRTIAAFANSAGGTLVIGVEDRTRRVVGLTDPLAKEEQLASLIADRIEPRLVPDLAIVSWRRQQLLVVTVQLSPTRPHWARAGKRAPAVYVRLGSTNRDADPQLIAQLNRESRGESFDESPLPDLSIDDLDLAAVNQAFEGRRRISKKELRTLGLVAEHQGRVVPTVAGTVLFGRNRAKALPDVWIQAGRFAGSDRTDIIDSARFDGLPLIELDRVMQFVERHSNNSIVIGGLQRTERREYPLRAVREALLNAVAHADYSQLGAPIRVSVFADRLEVESPGVMPFGLTIDDVRSGVSRLRNRAVARVLNELGFVEQWGSGIPRMIAACREAGLPDPEFVEVAGRLRVVLRSSKVEEAQRDAGDAAVIEALAGRPARTSEVAERVGRSIRWTRTRLNNLVENGVVVELGEGPNDPQRRYALASNKAGGHGT
jgi:ATP-dependent DNA helicase RecG